MALPRKVSPAQPPPASEVTAPAYTNGVYGLYVWLRTSVYHIVFHCVIHRQAHGPQILTVMHDETIELLLNTCLEI